MLNACLPWETLSLLTLLYFPNSLIGLTKRYFLVTCRNNSSRSRSFTSQHQEFLSLRHIGQNLRAQTKFRIMGWTDCSWVFLESLLWSFGASYEATEWLRGIEWGCKDTQGTFFHCILAQGRCGEHNFAIYKTSLVLGPYPLSKRGEMKFQLEDKQINKKCVSFSGNKNN